MPKVVLLPGDGIGSEILWETVKVLEAVGTLEEIDWQWEVADIGGMAIDKHGTPLPKATLSACQDAHGVLLGAVGGPKWDDLPGEQRPEAGLLRIRQGLGLFANLRPAKVLGPLENASTLKTEVVSGIDILVVRELIGGLYFGRPRFREGLPDGGMRAVDTLEYSTKEVERIARVAFQAARRRRQKLTSVDKANILESSRLWRETVMEVAGEFSDVELEHMFVDNCAMQLVRNQFDYPVVAITGSTGKTTTKDMTASIVSQLGPVLKSQENFNNEIGLPLTLLQMEAWHKAVIVEMGMRGLGQIQTLTELARPSVGVITNIGTVHLELLGSQKAIQKAKQELVETMEPGGIVALNADDPLVKEMASMALDKQIIYYSWQGANYDERRTSNTRYITATDVRSRGAQGVSFELCYDGHCARIDLPVPGEYQVSNALGAAAAALALGASLADVQIGLSEVSLSGMRMELLSWSGEGLVINDTYNANPTSMTGALKTAHEIAAGRPLILVLGDMLELGHLSRKAHWDIGLQAADLDPVYLVAVGAEAKGFVEGAQEAGMPLERIVQCTDREEAQQVVLQIARPGDVILVKGSRGMALENVVQALCAES
jgi:UDP-N-acetylmuramoyl-tripeptide--D-alanyl-D-alanine ligase